MTPADALLDTLSPKVTAFSSLVSKTKSTQQILKPVCVLRDISALILSAVSVLLIKYTMLVLKLVILSPLLSAVSMSTSMKTAVSVRLVM